MIGSNPSSEALGAAGLGGAGVGAGVGAAKYRVPRPFPRISKAPSLTNSVRIRSSVLREVCSSKNGVISPILAPFEPNWRIMACIAFFMAQSWRNYGVMQVFLA
jgi:hypothetical protein